MAHPDWLHKKVREKEDKFRQQKLNDIFGSANRDDIAKLNSDSTASGEALQNVEDLEDFRKNSKSSLFAPRPIVHSHGVNKDRDLVNASGQVDCPLNDHGKDANDIDKNVDYQGWLQSKKRKWKEMRENRKRQRYIILLALFDSNIDSYNGNNILLLLQCF